MPRASLAVADRRTQRAAVVGALHETRMSRTALVEQFGVSPALITRVVRGLLDDGVVRELGGAPQSIGRPAMQLEVIRHYGALVAVSCTGDEVRMRSSDLHESPLRSPDPISHQGRLNPEDLVDRIAQLVRLTPRTLGVGVAVPGVVDAETGDVSAAPDLGWEDTVPLRTMLRERLGVPVTIENDVNLMMSAERRTLEGAQRRDAVYLYLGGRGIGAGIIAGAGLLHGAHGAAGEIGLIPLTAGAAGADADFEDTVSTTAIAARLRSAEQDVGTDPIASMLQLADDGHETALAVRGDVIAAFAYAITVLTAILDPAVIILGGRARAFRERERSDIAASVSSRMPFHADLVFSRASDDGVLDSARRRAWSHVLSGGL